MIGSRMKQGVGANYQRKLLVAHHLDPARDMTPASMVQANGRIERQGNENEVVEIKYYGMQDTMTPGIFHRLQTKQHFIAQVLSGTGIGAEFEEAGTLNLEEMRNGLISDKRALVHTDLKLAIKEAKIATTCCLIATNKLPMRSGPLRQRSWCSGNINWRRPRRLPPGARPT